MSQTISVTVCKELPDRGALNGVLGKYYALIVARMNEMGMRLDPSEPEHALAEFWNNANDYLHPKGCLVVARDHDGQIVGCGMMKKLDAETGELKRLYVTDAVRGTGAGQKIVQMREQAARDMGLRRLIADTLTPNIEMRNLYPKLGFREVPVLTESTTYREHPAVRPHLHYFVKDLT